MYLSFCSQLACPLTLYQICINDKNSGANIASQPHFNFVLHVIACCVSYYFFIIRWLSIESTHILLYQFLHVGLINFYYLCLRHAAACVCVCCALACHVSANICQHECSLSVCRIYLFNRSESAVCTVPRTEHTNTFIQQQFLRKERNKLLLNHCH